MGNLGLLGPIRIFVLNMGNWVNEGNLGELGVTWICQGELGLIQVNYR